MHTLHMRCLGNLGIFETSTSHLPIQLDSISHKAPQYRISNTSTRPNLHGLYAWMHMLLYAWRLRGKLPWKKGRKKNCTRILRSSLNNTRFIACCFCTLSLQVMNARREQTYAHSTLSTELQSNLSSSKLWQKKLNCNTRNMYACFRACVKVDDPRQDNTANNYIG